MKKLLRVPLLLCCLFLFCAYFDHAPQFRFAWLSDTHIGSTNAAADLEASVRDINGMAGIEFVLLSGDVTEMGSDAELDQAKSILDGLEKPYYILPGNHDTKWSESGCTTFRQLFKQDRFEFSHGGFQVHRPAPGADHEDGGWTLCAGGPALAGFDPVQSSRS